MGLFLYTFVYTCTLELGAAGLHITRLLTLICTGDVLFITGMKIY